MKKKIILIILNIFILNFKKNFNMNPSSNLIKTNSANFSLKSSGESLKKFLELYKFNQDTNINIPKNNQTSNRPRNETKVIDPEIINRNSFIKFIATNRNNKNIPSKSFEKKINLQKINTKNKNSRKIFAGIFKCCFKDDRKDN